MSDVDTYRYDYPEKVPLSAEQLRTRLLGVAVLAGLWVGLGPWLVHHAPGLVFILGFATVVALLRLFAAPRRIELFARYLLCGPHLVYFRNVDHLGLDEQAGTLTIQYRQGNVRKRLVLERGRFPTKARKPHKIAANRQQKFGKVARRICQAVEQQAGVRA